MDPYYNLKALRAKCGLSQEKMAAVLNMSKLTYNRKENRKDGADFSIAEGKAIGTYFNRSPDDIFYTDTENFFT